MVTFDRACSIFAVGRKVGGISFFVVTALFYLPFMRISRKKHLLRFYGGFTYGGIFMSGKSCCFIGHRNVEDTEELQHKIRETVEKLINDEGVTLFLFGSRSDFDSICHGIVTDLQEIYPNIKRTAYTCRHETATVKEDKAEKERIWSSILKQSVHIKDYDAEYEHPTKYTCGKASYAERNQAMINDSDFCVFYFDETYKPPRRKHGKHDLADYQPKSGTAIAYAYAVQKKKRIYNLCEK